MLVEAVSRRGYRIKSMESSDAIDIKDVKSFLKVDHEEHDALILKMINTAVDVAEQYTGIPLRKKEIESYYDARYAYQLELPIIPAAEISNISCRCEKQKDQQIEPQNYYLTHGNSVVAMYEPVFGYLTVSYKVGYIKSAQIAESIKLGMLLHVAEMYDPESSDSRLEEVCNVYYRPHKVFGFI